MRPGLLGLSAESESALVLLRIQISTFVSPPVVQEGNTLAKARHRRRVGKVTSWIGGARKKVGAGILGWEASWGKVGVGLLDGRRLRSHIHIFADKSTGHTQVTHKSHISHT